MPNLMLALASLATLVAAQGPGGPGGGGSTTWSTQTYKSVDYTPPVLNITKSGAELATGSLFFTTTSIGGGPGSGGYSSSTSVAGGPVIMDDKGNLIWNGPSDGASYFAIQSFEDQPVLTAWSYASQGGMTDGYVTIWDQTYTIIGEVCLPELNIRLANGSAARCGLDLHESRITSRGTLIFTANNVTEADLTSVGGIKKGWVYDSQFHEYNLTSGEIIFSWKSLESGIPFNATHTSDPTGLTGKTHAHPWEWFHINAVQLTDDDGYLMNSRLLWTTFRLSPEGDIIWELNGETGGSFTLPDSDYSPLIAYAHHAQILNETSDSATFTIFDNLNGGGGYGGGGSSSESTPSMGLELQLNFDDMTATGLTTFIDESDLIYVGSEGSHYILDNGNHLIGYGSDSSFKEFGPDGDVRMTIEYGTQGTYRVQRVQWQAYPTTLPDIAYENATAYMSWNGATEVASWTVYAAVSNNSLAQVASAPNAGFETAISVNMTSGYYQVGAFDVDGNLLGKSAIASMS